MGVMCAKLMFSGMLPVSSDFLQSLCILGASLWLYFFRKYAGHPSGPAAELVLSSLRACSISPTEKVTSSRGFLIFPLPVRLLLLKKVTGSFIFQSLFGIKMLFTNSNTCIGKVY